jgi:hypothetical protein
VRRLFWDVEVAGDGRLVWLILMELNNETEQKYQIIYDGLLGFLGLLRLIKKHSLP